MDRLHKSQEVPGREGKCTAGGGAEVLDPAISDRAVGMEPEGSGGAEDIGV